MALAFSFPEPNPPPAKPEPPSLATAFEQAPAAVPMANSPASAGGLALPDVAQLTGLAELMRSQPVVGGNKELPAVAKLRQQEEERRHSFDTDLKMLRLRLERLEENRDQFNAEQRSDLVHTRNAMEERLDDVAALLGRDLRRLSELFENERATSGASSHRQQEMLSLLEQKVAGFDERLHKIESAISVLQETIKLGVLNLCQNPANEDSAENAEVERSEAWFNRRLEEQLPGLLQKMGIAGEVKSPFDAEAEPVSDSCPEPEALSEPESMEEVIAECVASSPEQVETAETVEMPLAAALDEVSAPDIPITALNLGEFMMQLDLRVGSLSEETQTPPGSETANAIELEVPSSTVSNDPSE